MNAATLMWAVTMAILTVVAFLIWRANGRSDQPEPDQVDDLAALYRDRREEPQQTAAWPPGTSSPLASPVDVALLDCGCIWAYYRTHTACSPCVIHDQDHWEGLENREGITS